MTKKHGTTKNSSRARVAGITGTDLLDFRIASRGQPVDVAAAAADHFVVAASRKPEALLLLSVAGWDADQREIPDIPKAMAYFRAFGLRLMELEVELGSYRYTSRLESGCRMIMLIATGIYPRSAIYFRQPSPSEASKKWDAEYAKAKKAAIDHGPGSLKKYSSQREE